MSTYGPANTTAAWYADNYTGSVIKPNVGVIHTTEGTSLPGYGGGATAPNLTGVPNMRAKRIDWFAHYPDERSARALVNKSGGVETNTLNAFQVELVGTCDPPHRVAWSGLRAGVDYIYWPDAPDWALREVAKLVADMNKRHGIKIQSVRQDHWLPYPSSYGNRNKQRMSGKDWQDFYGWCGHQHVPENVHGDPGNLNWTKIEQFAKEIVNGKAPEPARKPAAAKPAKVAAAEPTRIEKARIKFEQGLKLLDRAVDGGRVGDVKAARDDIRNTLNHTLPRR